MEPKTDPVIVNPHGKPARAAICEDCPRCGAGKEQRGPSCGFGEPKPLCLKCGYLWEGEVFRCLS